MKLPFKKLKAKMNPRLKNNINPNKEPRDIQKKYPLKSSPRSMRARCPIVVFMDNIYTL